MFKNNSYLRKTLIIYSTFISVIIMIFIFAYGWSQASSIKRDTAGTMKQLTSKASSQFEGILNEMSNISLGVANNQYVYDAMENTLHRNSKENYFENHIEEKKIIQKEIISLCSSNFDYKSFNVISFDYDSLDINTYESRMLPKEGLRKISWISKVMNNGLSKYISPVGKDEYYRTKAETFSFVRLIQNQFHKYGVIDVQYEKKFLDDIFVMKLRGSKMSVIVTDDSGLFYATDNAPTEFIKQLNKISPNNDTSQSIHDIKLSNELFTVCTDKINNYNMNIFVLVDSKDYFKPVYDASRTIIIFGIIILMILLLVVYIISYNLYKPIRQLRYTIDHIDYLSLSLDFQIDRSNNEILLLKNAFDKMFEGIKRTRNDLIESRTRELKANYQVLQEQINPHFMHNILSVIGLIGYQKNAPEIMDICSLLTRMLQYSTSTGKTVVKVYQEFEHVETYLKLMKYRYLDMLMYSITMEEKLRFVEIPKFILQPVVENCFSHSFINHVKSNYVIVIEGKVTQTGWEISVSDNGVGFTQESIMKLENQFREIENRIKNGVTMPDTEIGGLALINTYARLHLYSNGQITITMKKSDLGGACVTILCEGGTENDQSDGS